MLLDLFYVVLLVSYLLVGYRQGLIRRAVGSVGLLVGLFAAWRIAGPLASWLVGVLPFNLRFLDGTMIVYVAVLLVVAAAFELAGYLWDDKFDLLVVTGDKQLGALAGLLVAWIVAASLAYIIQAASMNGASREHWQFLLSAQVNHSFFQPGLFALAQHFPGILSQLVPAKLSQFGT